VSLNLGKYSFALGDKLEGTLAVSSEEEVDATEIRAEIRCEEKKKEIVHTTETITFSGGGHETRPVTKEEWKTRTIFSGNPRGSGSIHLSSGYRGEFPFSTTIAGGEPSYSGGDRNVTWTIKGVIGIKGRPDVTSSMSGIQVAMASAAPTVTMERIVEREVVMIPCQYCGSLFPQTVTNCPKCGAQRRA
jgi:Zn finger protein HypA/HybF involved in hydrogenase expression